MKKISEIPKKEDVYIIARGKCSKCDKNISINVGLSKQMIYDSLAHFQKPPQTELDYLKQKFKSKPLTFTNVGFEIEVEIYVRQLDETVPLGRISYWKPWNEWIWEQHPNIMMSSGCLDQVQEKLLELNVDYGG